VTLPVNLRTHAARKSAERLADKYLADNDNTPPKGRTPVYRGGRPAFNWAAKHDQYAAACLWLIARQRLPDSVVVANDNEPVKGGLDTRRNGTARGKVKPKSNLGEHLDIPAVLPRLGDAPPRGWAPAGHSRVDIRPQNDVLELSDEFRSFGACADGLAEGVVFIGAESGLGTPRPGKSRGSPLKAEEPEWNEPPPEVDYVLELMLAGEDLAGIGRAFGAKGRYQDKKGKIMLSKAMTWAQARVAETDFSANVTNRVT
jgi:hypothetical protein